MKRSIFGIYQLNEIVGAVVLACIGVFIAVLINAGLLKDWFQPSFTLRILLPDEGVSGLAPGAEVQVLGTRAGEIRRIVAVVYYFSSSHLGRDCMRVAEQRTSAGVFAFAGDISI